MKKIIFFVIVLFVPFIVYASDLSSLSVDSYTLTPAFSSDVLSYKVSADDVEKVTINASSSDSSATIDGIGEKTLKYGDNKFEVKVKSVSGETKTYKLVINRVDSRDKVNTLKNLVVEGYDLDKKFKSDDTTYSTTVESNVSKVSLKAELTSDKSTFVKNYGQRSVKLKYGDNTFKIKVQAENESVKEYTINITRIDDRDTNNDLGTLKISNGHYTFNKENTRYIINVLYNVSTLGVDATPDSDKASIEMYIGDKKVKSSNPYTVELNEGINKFKLVVIAENETKKEYEFTINRLKEGTNIEDVENVAYLSYLDINGKSATFNSKISDYHVEITSEDSLVFDYELSPGAKGTIELKDDVMGKIKLAEGRNSITISPVVDGSVVYLDLESAEGYSKIFSFNVGRADYYVGDITPTKTTLDIKWTYQLVIGLISFAIIVVELIAFAAFAVKNGGVENKKDDLQNSIKGGINGLKNFKFPKKKEKPKTEKKQEKTQEK